MVAIDRLWAAGAGGLLRGFPGGNAYAAHRHAMVRYHGQWHHALVCD